MTLRLNKPYMAFCGIAGTVGPAFFAWAITAQVYREWSRGFAISGGWSWAIVIGADFLCLLCTTGIYWKIYADSQTTIDDEGIHRPSIFGVGDIAWSEVTALEVSGDISVQIYTDKRRIAFTPHAYREPKRVIETLRQYCSAAKKRSSA